MILYLSGGDMEEALASKGIKHINLMLSYYTSFKRRNGIDSRMQIIYMERTKKRTKNKQKIRGHTNKKENKTEKKEEQQSFGLW